MNAPQALPNRGRGGTFIVDRKTQSKIRSACDALIVAGVSISEAAVGIANKFSLTETQSTAELERALERILAESERLKPFNRAISERRILGTIRDATKRHQYNAVANLEARLADVQGTAVPQEHHVQIDARMTQATLSILGSMSQEDVEELVQEQLQRMPVSSVALPTTGTTVKK